MDRLKKIIEIMTDEYSKTCGESGEREDCEGCKYWNVDCNLDYLIEVLLKWDKTIPKEKSIVLKNINLNNLSLDELYDKAIEDGKEFIDTIFSYIFSCDNDNFDHEDTEKCKEYAIEVFWNMVQLGIGFLQKINVDADEVMEEYPKHLQKIKQHDYKLREKVQK